ncbi:MAG: alanine--glyoxylate aminotransferase family protein, partial [Caldilineaceae bacterium]|nr:alanine--glyoxylate aminotransferase family protein [Caldilineaceae bacterium]
AEGVEARYARHARLAERTRRWAVENGFDLMAERGYASQTVTTVTNTRSISVKALNAFLARHDMEISNGYGD